MNTLKSPQRLKNLRVAEISSVDRGANSGAKIVFSKRDSEIAKAVDETVAALIDDDAFPNKRATLVEVCDRLLDHVDALDEPEVAKTFNEVMVEKYADADEPADDEAADITKGKDDRDPILQVAKMAVQGAPCTATRSDFYAELCKRAQAQRQGGESAEQSFVRFITSDPDGRLLYRAHKSLPGPDYDPGHGETAGTSRPAPASFKTTHLTALNKLAAELRTREPKLSEAQAFTKVYTDPANRELVAAERRENRPSAPPVEKSRSTVGDRVARLAAAKAKQHPGLSHDEAIQCVLTLNPDLARAYQREQSEQAV